MTPLLVKIIQLILSLSILIVLHELGHFIPAKIFKTRIEKFYLFFDPWFSLFKKKIGGTEYGIGWLPLGGYVKISGMIDESMDTEQMKTPPKSYEFRSKPAWQRLIIMIGGVTVNVILAFFIYAMILFGYGKEYVPIENLTYGVQADSLLLEHGIENGDLIKKVGEITPETLNEVNREILFGDARRLTLERDGREINVNLPEDIDQDLLAKGGTGFFFVRFPNQVEAVAPDSYAEKAGLQKGDRIVAVNNTDTEIFYDLTNTLQDNKDQMVNLRVRRDGRVVELQSQVDSLGRLGFIPSSDFSNFFETVKLEYGFFESFPAGVSEGTETLVSYVRSLKLIFSRQGVKQVGGFGTIAGLFGEIWDWERFWNMTAFLSIILAVMNLLPIPALDGGHVMFLLYEMIAGRQPNQKFMEYAQLFGIAVLLTLLLYANGNDVVNADWFARLSDWFSNLFN